MTEAGLAILCECEPTYNPDRAPGFWRNDAARIAHEATQWDRSAAEALAKLEADPDHPLRHRRRLVMAINAIDADAWHGISNYSNLAAVSADREDYAVARESASRGKIKEYAERRHAKRESEALEIMLDQPSRTAQLRVRLVQALRKLGVDFVQGSTDPDNPCVKAFHDHACAYRCWDTLRKYPQYPETTALRERMKQLGIA